MQEVDAERLLLDERARNTKLEEDLYNAQLAYRQLARQKKKGKILVNIDHLLNDVQFMHNSNEKLGYLEYEDEHYVKMDSIQQLGQRRPPAKIIDHSRDVY